MNYFKDMNYRGRIDLMHVGLIVLCSFLGTVLFVQMTDKDEIISRGDWRAGEAYENHQILETSARTSDSIVVLVETWHDLRLDPDDWNYPEVVRQAVRSATKRYTVDSIVNYHDNFTIQILRDAQWLVGNTNLAITVNTVSWECPGQPLCGGGAETHSND